LNFKVNQEIKQIIDDTKISLDALRADLRTIKESKFLCCGTEYEFTYLVVQKSSKPQ